MKAEKILADIRVIYNKNSYIDNKKTAEQLLEEQAENKNTFNELSLLPKNNNENKTNAISLNIDLQRNIS